MPEYTWKAGSRINHVDAQVAGAVFSQIEAEYNQVTPEVVLEVSRPEDAPLHPAFTWDDAVAAEKWRLSESGHLLRCLVTIEKVNDEDVPIRAYWPVVTPLDGEDSQRGYISTARVLADVDARRQVFERALNELKAFQRKYGHLKELSDVFAVVEKLSAAESLSDAA